MKNGRTVGKAQGWALCLILFSVFFRGKTQAQALFPAPGPLFADTSVPRIDIFLPPDSLALLLAPGNESSNYPWHATFVFDNGAFRDTVYDVGFRLRGNTSRLSQKKSFKVLFDTYVPGREYLGVDGLNLNGEHNDPSIMRTKLCFDLMRKAGVPAPRANHVALYINGAYRGLYVNVEHIDGEYCKTRYGTHTGNRYKCLYPADLDWLGPLPQQYQYFAGVRQPYDLVNNGNDNDYADLAALVNVLKYATLSGLPCALEEIFDVDTYLKIMAIEVLTGHWDNYSFNQNNYYLYRDPLTKKFVMIPYDLDNTIGIDFLGQDWGVRNIYEWKPNGPARPLYERIMDVTEYRNRFSYYVERFAQTLIGPSFYAAIEAHKNRVAPFAEADSFRVLDYGYTVVNFYQSYLAPLGAHANYGLVPFLQTRRANALAQVQLSNIRPVLRNARYRVFGPQGPVRFEVEAEDESLAEVRVLYQLNGGAWQSLPLYDDGAHADGAAGDSLFAAQLNTVQMGAVQIEMYWEATDSVGFVSRYPRCGNHSFGVPALMPSLRLNELVAQNNGNWQDEHGDTDDWVEIFNADTVAVFLGDKYLTDDSAQPDQWMLPAVTLLPGDYLRIWADGEGHEGNRHANFSLSAGGETLGLYGSRADGFGLIDMVTFGAQPGNVSFGRLPNGTGNWQILPFASPGANNEWPVGTHAEDERPTGKWRVIPNPPVGGHICLEVRGDLQGRWAAMLFDTQGRSLVQWHFDLVGDRVYLPLEKNAIPAGQYWLRLEGETKELSVTLSVTVF